MPAQHPLRHAAQLCRLQHRRDTHFTGMVGPLPEGVGDTVGQRIPVGGKLFGGVPEEHRRRGRANHPGPVRLVERLQQGQPVVAGVGGEDVRVTGVDRRDAGVGQRLKAGPGVFVLLHDHRDVTGFDPGAVEGGVAGQQRADVGGEVARDEVAKLPDRDDLGSGAVELLPGHHPKPERIVMRGADEPGPGMVGFDFVHDDAPVTQFGAAEHRLQTLQQIGVAAPVRRQGLLLAGGVGRQKVGDDVAAAEGVDGLFGVPDQNQGAHPGERPVDHRPLHRVGVLELVDHDDRPAPAHPLPGRGVVGFQRIGEPGQQIVVAQDAAAAFADLQFGQHGLGEVDAHRRVSARLGVARPQLGRRVAGHRPRQRQRLAVGDRRVLALPAEPGQVEIIDNLGDQIIEALDQFHPGIAVSGDPQRGQHQPAELVHGGDGGGIESGQCVDQIGAPPFDFVRAARQQVLEDQVAAGQAGILESGYRVGDLAANPVTQLLGGRPAEGDQQHLIESGLALGDVAGDQSSQRERLTRSGTGLQDRGGVARRQRTEEVEAGGFGHGLGRGLGLGLELRLHQRPLASACSTGSHTRAA